MKKAAPPHPLLFSLQDRIVDLALVDRNHHLTAQERCENDVEHSFAVAMLCWLVYEKSDCTLDLQKILQYALIHDFGEVYAGDTNTYADSKARQRKVELERAAIERLSKEFDGFPGMITLLQAYEGQVDEEAQFVWTVDKLQALILGSLDNWRPYKKIGITYDRFVQKHHEQLSHCSPYCKDIFTALLAYFQTTFYDQPAP